MHNTRAIIKIKPQDIILRLPREVLYKDKYTTNRVGNEMKEENSYSRGGKIKHKPKPNVLCTLAVAGPEIKDNLEEIINY